MNGMTDEDNTNVIELNFNQLGNEIPHDISHPESTRFAEEEIEDPLNDLLHEFDDIEDENDDSLVQEDFIYHLKNYQDEDLDPSQAALEMSQILLKKASRLKEDVKRVKYYLDEMNLED